jgi:RNA polymerase sigma factor (sigma-70 family)
MLTTSVITPNLIQQLSDHGAKTVDTDVELLHKWREGDASAGEALFRRHVATLYRFFCTKVAGNVDDLVQQTLVACVENQDGFEERASFRAYLLGVARFQLYSYYRNSRRDKARFEFDTVTVFDLDPSPSTRASEQRERRLLLEALRRLPVNFQIALELSYWEDMTAPEIAHVLGIPPDTVYSRLRRARELLAGMLKRLSEAGERLDATESNLEGWAAGLRDDLSEESDELIGGKAADA